MYNLKGGVISLQARALRQRTDSETVGERLLDLNVTRPPPRFKLQGEVQGSEKEGRLRASGCFSPRCVLRKTITSQKMAEA